MKGEELKQLRKGLRMERWQFAALLGYTGTHRNNSSRLRRFENGQQQVPLYIAKLAWLIRDRIARTGVLPIFPAWPGYEFDHSPDPQAGELDGPLGE